MVSNTPKCSFISLAIQQQASAILTVDSFGATIWTVGYLRVVLEIRTKVRNVGYYCYHSD